MLGVTNNRGFLLGLLEDTRVRAGAVSTDLIAKIRYLIDRAHG